MYCHPDGPGGGSSANAAAGDDLYDDVLAAGASSSSDAVKDEKSSELRSPSGDRSEAKYPGRKYQVYVGNLTWWTTDQDIQDAVQGSYQQSCLLSQFVCNVGRIRYILLQLLQDQ